MLELKAKILRILWIFDDFLMLFSILFCCIWFLSDEFGYCLIEVSIQGFYLLLIFALLYKYKNFIFIFLFSRIQKQTASIDIFGSSFCLFFSIVIINIKESSLINLIFYIFFLCVVKSEFFCRVCWLNFFFVIQYLMKNMTFFCDKEECDASFCCQLQWNILININIHFVELFAVNNFICWNLFFLILDFTIELQAHRQRNYETNRLLVRFFLLEKLLKIPLKVWKSSPSRKFLTLLFYKSFRILSIKLF